MMAIDYGRYSTQREDFKVNSFLILHCYLLSFDEAYLNISLFPLLSSPMEGPILYRVFTNPAHFSFTIYSASGSGASGRYYHF